MQWIRTIEESEDVLWLYGSAGAGKSAIAQTIAELCAELGLIVASFFFSRASQSRNNERHLVSSIAYQLAISIPATRSYIESAVQIDPAIFDRSLETQIKTLITRPLENACDDVNLADSKKWPKLIIIDGLDECNGPAIQCSIVRLLSRALRRVPVPLILLVASRPEPHIRNTFNLLIKSEYGSLVSRHIVLDDSYEPDTDIKEFIVSRFNEIKENHHLATYIPESWPSEEIIDQLVRKSSGQFIYASTVMKYLDSPKHWLMRRLDVIMGLIPVVGDIPYRELDAL
jgi:NACHT domain